MHYESKHAMAIAWCCFGHKVINIIGAQSTAALTGRECAGLSALGDLLLGLKARKLLLLCVSTWCGGGGVRTQISSIAGTEGSCEAVC